MKRRLALLAALVIPWVSQAQLRPTASPVLGALVKKTIPIANITAAQGSSIAVVNAYGGDSCVSGCVVANAGLDGKSGVSVRFAERSVRVEEVRTAVVISHEKAHSLGMTLNGNEILGLLCNGMGAITASPKFSTLGAVNAGFKWAIFQGSKMLSSGHSNGEAVKWNGDGHTMGPMQLAVFSDATVEVSHGDMRLVMTSDEGATIESKSGGSLRFETLGLSVAGASEFGVMSAQIQGVTK